MGRGARSTRPRWSARSPACPQNKIRAAAELYAQTARAGIFYTLGITEHTTGTANVINLANLAMVTGHVGVPHAGVNPLRGQNNVQGACDMGALPNVFSDYRSVTKPENAAVFEKAWGVELSRELGLRTPEMFDAMVAGELKAMYVMGEDPVLTDADANHVRKAIDALDFLVVQDIFLTETAKYADVVLPAACYAEKDGTFTNTERRVQRVRKAVEPPGRGPCRLGDHLPTSPPAWATPWSTTRRPTSSRRSRTLTPTYAGMTYDRVDACGLQWPCPDLDHPGTPYLHEDVFPRGRGRLMGIEYEAPAELTNDDYPHPAHHRAHALPVQHLHPAVADPRVAGALRADRDQSRRTRSASGVEDGDQMRVTSRRGSVVTSGQGHRPGAAGHPLHDLPLLGDAGERAHQLGLRPHLQHGRVQGVGGQDREGLKTSGGPARPARRPRRDLPERDLPRYDSRTSSMDSAPAA